MPRPAGLLLAALLACAAAPARATVVLPLDLGDLVDHADRIVLGRVESQVARWTADHGAIYTEVTLRVERALKGDLPAGALVTVRREGGEVGAIGMLVHGAARFAVGEEALVFLERRAGASWTVGMAQGRMRIATVDGRRVAIRDTAGLGFVGRPPPEPAVRPLDEVLRAIAAQVGRSRR